MTQPTFEQLLASQEARDRAVNFDPAEGWGPYFMTPFGSVVCFKEKRRLGYMAVWQGWLTDAPPPPEPRVFNDVRYVNYYANSGFYATAYYDRETANCAAKRHVGERLACVRVEITATEGQFDD